MQVDLEPEELELLVGLLEKSSVTGRETMRKVLALIDKLSPEPQRLTPLESPKDSEAN